MAPEGWASLAVIQASVSTGIWASLAVIRALVSTGIRALVWALFALWRDSALQDRLKSKHGARTPVLMYSGFLTLEKSAPLLSNCKSPLALLIKRSCHSRIILTDCFEKNWRPLIDDNTPIKASSRATLPLKIKTVIFCEMAKPFDNPQHISSSQMPSIENRNLVRTSGVLSPRRTKKQFTDNGHFFVVVPGLDEINSLGWKSWHDGVILGAKESRQERHLASNPQKSKKIKNFIF